MQEKKPQDRGARFLLVAASLVLVVAGMRAVKTIALPLLVATFLSILSVPLLTWLLRRRIPRPVAVVTTVLANVSVMAVLLLLVGGSINEFKGSVPKYQAVVEAKAEGMLERLEGWGIDTSELNWLQKNLDPEGEGGEPPAALPVVPPPSREPSPAGLFNLSSVVDLIGSTLRSIASILSMTLLVFLLMVFILFEASGFPRKLKLIFGWSDQDLEHFTTEIQRYLVIKTLICLMTGILVGLGVWVLGVQYPLLWGLTAFLFNYVPSIGSIIAAVPPVLLTWLDQGLAQAFLVGLVFLAVNVTFGNFLEPHLMGRRFGISTLVVVLSLIFWGWLWGPVGMLLSVPLTMILKIVLENTEDFRWLAQLIGSEPRKGKSLATTSATLEIEEPPLVSTPKG